MGRVAWRARRLQRLRLRIMAAQSDEIAMMRRWLRERQQEVPDSNAIRHVVKMGDMVHEMRMPGMLTDEQMAALDKADGPGPPAIDPAPRLAPTEAARRWAYALRRPCFSRSSTWTRSRVPPATARCASSRSFLD